MSREVEVIVANPAGNITIMVLTPTPRMSIRRLQINYWKLILPNWECLLPAVSLMILRK